MKTRLLPTLLSFLFLITSCGKQHVDVDSAKIKVTQQNIKKFVEKLSHEEAIRKAKKIDQSTESDDRKLKQFEDLVHQVDIDRTADFDFKFFWEEIMKMGAFNSADFNTDDSFFMKLYGLSTKVCTDVAFNAYVNEAAQFQQPKALDAFIKLLETHSCTQPVGHLNILKMAKFGSENQTNRLTEVVAKRLSTEESWNGLWLGVENDLAAFKPNKLKAMVKLAHRTCADTPAMEKLLGLAVQEKGEFAQELIGDIQSKERNECFFRGDQDKLFYPLLDEFKNEQFASLFDYLEKANRLATQAPGIAQSNVADFSKFYKEFVDKQDQANRDFSEETFKKLHGIGHQGCHQQKITAAYSAAAGIKKAASLKAFNQVYSASPCKTPMGAENIVEIAKWSLEQGLSADLTLLVAHLNVKAVHEDWVTLWEQVNALDNDRNGDLARNALSALDLLSCRSPQDADRTALAEFIHHDNTDKIVSERVLGRIFDTNKECLFKADIEQVENSLLAFVDIDKDKLQALLTFLTANYHRLNLLNTPMARLFTHFDANRSAYGFDSSSKLMEAVVEMGNHNNFANRNRAAFKAYINFVLGSKEGIRKFSSMTNFPPNLLTRRTGDTSDDLKDMLEKIIQARLADMPNWDESGETYYALAFANLLLSQTRAVGHTARKVEIFNMLSSLQWGEYLAEVYSAEEETYKILLKYLMENALETEGRTVFSPLSPQDVVTGLIIRRYEITKGPRKDLRDVVLGTSGVADPAHERARHNFNLLIDAKTKRDNVTKVIFLDNTERDKLFKLIEDFFKHVALDKVYNVALMSSALKYAVVQAKEYINSNNLKSNTRKTLTEQDFYFAFVTQQVSKKAIAMLLRHYSVAAGQDHPQATAIKEKISQLYSLAMVFEIQNPTATNHGFVNPTVTNFVRTWDAKAGTDGNATLQRLQEIYNNYDQKVEAKLAEIFSLINQDADFQKSIDDTNASFIWVEGQKLVEEKNAIYSDFYFNDVNKANLANIAAHKQAVEQTAITSLKRFAAKAGQYLNATHAYLIDANGGVKDWPPILIENSKTAIRAFADDLQRINSGLDSTKTFQDYINAHSVFNRIHREVDIHMFRAGSYPVKLKDTAPISIDLSFVYKQDTKRAIAAEDGSVDTYGELFIIDDRPTLKGRFEHQVTGGSVLNHVVYDAYPADYMLNYYLSEHFTVGGHFNYSYYKENEGILTLINTVDTKSRIKASFPDSSIYGTFGMIPIRGVLNWFNKRPYLFSLSTRLGVGANYFKEIGTIRPAMYGDIGFEFQLREHIEIIAKVRQHLNNFNFDKRTWGFIPQTDTFTSVHLGISIRME